MPVFEFIPSVRRAWRMRPLFVGRIQALSSSDMTTLPRFRFSVKNLQRKVFQERPAPALVPSAWLTSAIGAKAATPLQAKQASRPEAAFRFESFQARHFSNTPE